MVGAALAGAADRRFDLHFSAPRRCAGGERRARTSAGRR